MLYPYRNDQEYLEALTKRLAVLLAEMDPEERKDAMRWIEQKMFEEGLIWGANADRMTPDEFANLMLRDNPMIPEMLQALRSKPLPARIETPGDLIVGILPAYGSLE
jgi:hypothetical protein